jgi:hypothetical protein
MMHAHGGDLESSRLFDEIESALESLFDRHRTVRFYILRIHDITSVEICVIHAILGCQCNAAGTAAATAACLLRA